MKNTEGNKAVGDIIGTQEERYKICPKCKERVPDSSDYCPYCGLKFDKGSVPEKKSKKKRSKANKTILSRKKIIRILLMIVVIADVILSVWGVKRIKELRKTDIIVSTSDLEIETGEKAEVLIDIINPPLDYIITYDDNNAVLEKWMNWEEDKARIPISLMGLKETKDKLHIYIYDRAEYLKNERDKVVLAEKSIPITVKHRSDVFLRTDKEINLSVEEPATVTVTIEGDLPDDFYLSVSTPAFLETKWGEWINDYKCPITLTGLSASSDELVISLYDTSVIDEGICLCSAKIKVNVQ